MGHEHSLVDEFLAIGFVCIFLYHLNQAMQKASGIDWDNIELFRITDIYAKDCELKTNQSTVDNSRTETKKRQTQNKKKKTQKKVADQAAKAESDAAKEMKKNTPKKKTTPKKSFGITLASVLSTI